MPAMTTNVNADLELAEAALAATGRMHDYSMSPMQKAHHHAAQATLVALIEELEKDLGAGMVPA